MTRKEKDQLDFFEKFDEECQKTYGKTLDELYAEEKIQRVIDSFKCEKDIRNELLERLKNA